MKYLPAILFISTVLLATPRSFFLPDEADHARYHLKQAIAAAQSSILLISPKIKSRSIEKALSKAAKRGVAVTLVTSGKTDDAAAALVRFGSVDYRIIKGLQTDYRSGELTYTMIRIDDRLQCMTSLPLSDEHFEHDIAQLRCSKKLTVTDREYSDRILQRSKPYLIP